MNNEVICKICGFKSPTSIQQHLRWKHSEITVKEYKEKYKCEIISESHRNHLKKSVSKANKGKVNTREQIEKQRKSNKEFWATHPERKKEVGDRMHNLSLEGKHPSQTDEFRQQAKENAIKRNKTEKQRVSVKKAMTDREFSQEWKDAISKGHIGNVLSEETKKKISITQKKGFLEGSRKPPGGNIGKIWSDKNKTFIYYRSELEMIYIKELEILDWVETYDSESLRIKYILDGESHTYFPDFLINNNLVIEINSYNVFYLNKQKKEIKAEAARKYCKERGWTYKILYEDDLGIEYDLIKEIKNYKFPRN